jgi:hypothetical protein
MSATNSMFGYGNNYWSYMAIEMHFQLNKIIRKKSVDKNSIPKGVFLDARNFLSLAYKATSGEFNLDPSVNFQALSLAAETASSLSFGSKTQENDLKKELSEFLHLLKNLEHLKTLNENDIKIAKKMTKFFEQLAKEGEYSEGLEDEQEDRELVFDNFAIC